MAKPGVMFYFEIRPCIKRLTLEEKGQLFEAILDYGEYGAIPEVDGAVPEQRFTFPAMGTLNRQSPVTVIRLQRRQERSGSVWKKSTGKNL